LYHLNFLAFFRVLFSSLSVMVLKDLNHYAFHTKLTKFSSLVFMMAPATLHVLVSYQVFNLVKDLEGQVQDGDETHVLNQKSAPRKGPPSQSPQQMQNSGTSDSGVPPAPDAEQSPQCKRSLKVLQANVDVLTNKKDELLLLNEIVKPDIICLQEVLPKNPGIGGCSPEVELKLAGYSMFCVEQMKRGTVTI
jgi:hypothetical protein